MPCPHLAGTEPTHSSRETFACTSQAGAQCLAGQQAAPSSRAFTLFMATLSNSGRVMQPRHTSMFHSAPSLTTGPRFYLCCSLWLAHSQNKQGRHVGCRKKSLAPARQNPLKLSLGNNLGRGVCYLSWQMWWSVTAPHAVHGHVHVALDLARHGPSPIAGRRCTPRLRLRPAATRRQGTRPGS